MNKMIRRTIWALVLAGTAAFTAQAQTRIGIVDYKKVVAGYWKTKEATTALKERREDLLKELKGLGEDIKKGEEDYKKLIEDANDPGVSAEEREKRKSSAETKLKSISEMKDRAREFDRNASANLNEQAARMSDRIDEKVRTVVTARAKSAGYGLVLDITSRSADNRPVVLYNNGDNDMTEGVLEQLNSDAPAEPAKGSEAKPEKTDKKEDKK